MSDLRSITTTQEIEIDLLDLNYNYIDSLEEFKELAAEISPHIVDAYHEEIEVSTKDKIINELDSAESLHQFLLDIDESIVTEYKQQLLTEEKQSFDLIDRACSTNEDELHDLLICILNQHSQSLHRLLVNCKAEIKLAMIESAQAILNDLEIIF